MLTLKGSTMKFTQPSRKSLFTGDIIGQQFLKSQNMLTALCRQKVTKQGKMCRFSTTIIENTTFAIFTHYELFSAETGTMRLQLRFQKSFSHFVPRHDATSWNWDNQNQPAKSFQMKSILNNQNYETSSITNNGVIIDINM